jgi:hypothetical protein
VGSESELFDRHFAEGDEILFSRLVAGLRGQECIAWRKSYGDTGSLHFGELVPKRVTRPRTVHKDRGTWVLWLWACDHRLTLPSGERIDSEIESVKEVVGSAVRDIRIDPGTLGLRLEFSNGVILELLTDLADTGDEEQWSLMLPGTRAVTAWAGRRWALQEEP